MIGPGTGVRVYLACGVTDIAEGIAELSALAQDQLRQNPSSGAVFAFRGRRGDRLKLLYWDGQGFCLYYKVLEQGRFPWPSAADGVARLTSGQMARLVGGHRLAPSALGRAARAGGVRSAAERRSTPCFARSSLGDRVGQAMSDALPSDPAELRAAIAGLEAENARMAAEVDRMTATLRAQELLVQALHARIAKLQRQRFGPSSEKIEREIEQLELALEDLQVAAVEGDAAEPADPGAEGEADGLAEAPKPRRRPRAAEGTPRERRVLGPGEACPDCGGDLRIVGEDVSELACLIAAKLKVIEIARPKASCRRCERMVQGEPSSAIGPRTMASAPSRPVPRSMAGPGLLAHVLVSKFDDHVPLYRQAEILARMGADIPDTTLVDWCGRAMKVLQPAIEGIEADVMACDLLHGL